MKQRLPVAVALLSCVLTLVCLVQIAQLNGQVTALRSNLSSQIQRVDSSVQSIRSDVGSQLERGASILSGQAFTYGKLDVKSGTVALLCSVTPRESIPGETTATLYWSGGEMPMTPERGAFTATLALPLFGDAQIDRVVFSQNGLQRTEGIDSFYSPRAEFLPWIDAFLDGTSSGSNGSYHRSGALQLYVNSPRRNARVISTTLIEVLNGQEVGRETLTPEITDSSAEGDYFHASYPVDKTYAVPAGAAHELWVEVVDGYGLRYRMLIDRWIGDEHGGAPDDSQWIWQGAGAEILDDQGNVLYRPEQLEP